MFGLDWCHWQISSLPLLICGLSLGCDDRSDSASLRWPTTFGQWRAIASQTIELVPPTGVVITGSPLVAISVPPGMSVMRRIPVRSRFETPLTHLLAASSCGCTSAAFDSDTLGPGATGTLSCVFDGHTTAESRDIKIRVISPDVPAGLFLIDLRFKSDPEQSNIKISSVPSSVSIDEFWQSEHRFDYKFALTFGEVDPKNWTA